MANDHKPVVKMVKLVLLWQFKLVVQYELICFNRDPRGILMDII
jgi:hypothetical protein